MTTISAAFPIHLAFDTETATFHQYALSLTESKGAVPEPTTLALMGLGLLFDRSSSFFRPFHVRLRVLLKIHPTNLQYPPLSVHDDYILAVELLYSVWIIHFSP